MSFSRAAVWGCGRDKLASPSPRPSPQERVNCSLPRRDTSVIGLRANFEENLNNEAASATGELKLSPRACLTGHPLLGERAGVRASVQPRCFVVCAVQ